MGSWPHYTVASFTIDGEKFYVVHAPHSRPVTLEPLSHEEAVILCERLNAAVPEPWDG